MSDSDIYSLKTWDEAMLATLKFSDFILDSRRFELRRGERILKLEKISMELLILRAEREGDLVSRDEIVEKLWGKDVFIEADRSINTAVSKLRVALRDNPERPRYIQTVVGKGYRFIASISQPQSPQTLAVLPFRPLSNGSSDEHLELGMADSLITKLSRSGRLIVRPTSAIRKYTGVDCETLAAGRALQVDAVLQGNIQHVGSQLRVSIRLIRVRDGRSLWSDSYDARFTDVFQVQDTVSERVVDAARSALGHALARAGATSEAQQILNDLITLSRTEHVSSFHLAIICAGLGDDESALNWLEKAYDQSDSAISGLSIEPRFRTLRTHPRFRSLLRRMRLGDTDS